MFLIWRAVALQYQHMMFRVSFYKLCHMNVWKATRDEPLHPCILKVILQNEARRIQYPGSGDLGEAQKPPAADIYEPIFSRKSQSFFQYKSSDQKGKQLAEISSKMEAI